MEFENICPLAGFLNSFFVVAEFSVLNTTLLLFLSLVFFTLFYVIPCVYLISYVEKKFAADIQIRKGPNRSGRYGLLQPIADVLKSISKENKKLASNQPFFTAYAPLLTLSIIFCIVCFIPIAHDWIVSEQTFSVIVIFILMSVTNLIRFFGNYSTKNSFSILLSYKYLGAFGVFSVPFIVGLIPIFALSGTTSLTEIVKIQTGLPWNWFIVRNPSSFVSAVCVFVSLSLWQSKRPFGILNENHGDMINRTAGFNRIVFDLTDKLSTLFGCSFFVSVYLGGWIVPFDLEYFGRAASFFEYGYFLIKMTLVLFLTIWIRNSCSEMRTDQTTKFSWQVLIPISFLGAILSILIGTV